MSRAATLRLWGTCLGYLGMLLVVLWIGWSIWVAGGKFYGGTLIDLLSQVTPGTWLLIPAAGLPGFLIHLAGDKLEARERGVSMREVQFSRHLRFQKRDSARIRSGDD